MAFVCPSCSLGTVFKKFLIGFCGLFFLEYMLNVRMIDTIYATTKVIKNTLPIDWSKTIKNISYFIDEHGEDNFSIVIQNLLKYENIDVNLTEVVTNTNTSFDPCPAEPPGLIGPIDINLTSLSLSDVDKLKLDLDYGGHYSPPNCKPKDKVAIIIPFRNREAHLSKFLNNIHPFLKKQLIEYKIYVVEQRGTGKFNRAKLFNIGFVEANRQNNWDCFIFHDVDLLPMDDRNLYTCPPQPRHLTAAIDKFDFKLPYLKIFGGATAMTTEQFKTVNGFSNSFWGWGGEDDDMYNRLVFHNYGVIRYPMEIARYTMLDHEKEIPNPKRFEILSKGKSKFDNDGLNSLQYILVETKLYKTCTLFLVDVLNK